MYIPYLHICIYSKKVNCINYIFLSMPKYVKIIRVYIVHIGKLITVFAHFFKMLSCKIIYTRNLYFVANIFKSSTYESRD